MWPTCWWKIISGWRRRREAFFHRTRTKRVSWWKTTRVDSFHNLRHSLASFLVRRKTDPKTVQALLRHSDVKTTLQLYAHSVSEDRMTAQGTMLQAILGAGTGESGLRAD